MFVLALIAVLALSLAPSAWAQNGFPDAKAANHQYEPHPPPPGGGGGNGNGNNGNGNGNNGKPPGKPDNPGGGNKDKAGTKNGCSTTSARARKAQFGCPGGEVGPDTAGGGKAGGERGVSANGLPLATAQGGRLPFTGLDLLMLSSLGALLLAAGFGLRAAARTRSRGV